MLKRTLFFVVVLDVRNKSAQQSWDVFNKLLDETPPLNGSVFFFQYISAHECDFTAFLLFIRLLKNSPGGKLGFYYRDHEILPPLPGFLRISKKLSLDFVLSKITFSTGFYVLIDLVGYHRYVLNLNEKYVNEVQAHEVQAFDAPSEVSKLYLMF